MKALALLALALFPTGALAQPVLFDDFDGDTLAPNWSYVASRWQYNVSNSMLNVTALTYPSSPESDINFASMGSLFSTQAEFRVDAWMGWSVGDPPDGIEFVIVAPTGNILATLGYRNTPTLGPPRIVAGAGNQAGSFPAPPPGIHQFTLTRVAGTFEFFLDGSSLTAIPDQFGRPAAGIVFDFSGPFPGQLGGLHIDRVQVVPAPTAFVLLPAAFVGFCGRRRRFA